jgi:hypothetical protein
MVKETEMVRRMRIAHATLGLSMLLCACQQTAPESPPQSDLLSGTIVLFDNHGKAVATGDLTLAEGPFSSRILGATWHLRTNHSGLPDRAFGPGVPAVISNSDVLALNLAPHTADSHVLLNGTLAGHDFQGQWISATIDGARPMGEFRGTMK